MLDKDFTHLHLHTTYSMLDGAIRIPELMKHLKKVDEIAYIRFASVYQSFKDVQTFQRELNKLLKTKKTK